MTLSEVYREGLKVLQQANIENAAFDNMSIFEHCFDLKRQDVSLYRENIAPAEKLEKFLLFINERKNGKPLQYILGHWDFMGRKFLVGQGVLIPRDDTEVLVNKALDLVKNKKNAKILDLCSGSGAVAILLADILKTSEVTAVEVSDNAIEYLKENIKLNNATNVLVKKLDILNGDIPFLEKEFDLIVSNPPYIKSSEIKTLQKEVQFEPKLALDGGEDGLIFYKSIARRWKRFLTNDGSLCVEIGIGQDKEVASIFKNAGFLNVKTLRDINGISRVVCADN
ncbi:MAG: Release factor glutamine methyltransferase [Eubacteriales bacterium SKADARSKE-1]|nr:Release factor glutamine methyltransferase [Eubacteriales bacterium SKADARSKE-1]